MAGQKAEIRDETKRPRIFYGYIIVLASFLVLMVSWGTLYCFGVFFKPVLSELGWTREVTAGAYSLNLLVQGAWGLVAGKLNDRFGPRLVVTISGVLIGTGYLLMSRIEAVWQIYLCYGVLIGIGVAGTWIPLLSTIARWFIKRRGLASGIVAAGIGFGTIFLPLLANRLIAAHSWRTAFIIIGILAPVIIVVIAQWLRRDPAQKGLSAYGASPAQTVGTYSAVPGLSFREATRTWQLPLIIVFLFFFAYCLHTMMVHIVPHATDIGISANASAALLSTIGLVSIGSKIGLGSAGDKTGNRVIAILVFILLAVCFALLQLGIQLWLLYIAAVIFGIGWGGLSAAQSPLVAEYFGLKAHGVIYGFIYFIGIIGGALGSLIAGRIFDATGNYQWAFMLCVIFSLISLGLAFILKPMRRLTAIEMPK